MNEFAVMEGAELKKPPRGPKRRYPFHTLPVDGIFFVPDKDHKFRTYVASQGRELGRKFRAQLATMRRNAGTGEWEPCANTEAGARNGMVITRVS